MVWELFTCVKPPPVQIFPSGAAVTQYVAQSGWMVGLKDESRVPPDVSRLILGELPTKIFPSGLSATALMIPGNGRAPFVNAGSSVPSASRRVINWTVWPWTVE